MRRAPPGAASERARYPLNPAEPPGGHVISQQQTKLIYRANEPLISARAYENLRQVLDERYLSPGAWVEAFEARWAEVCGTRFAVAASSGTAALHIAMLAAGVKAGDEVIVPAMTCPDTLNAAAFIGARPVIVDIERERYGIRADYPQLNLHQPQTSSSPE